MSFASCVCLRRSVVVWLELPTTASVGRLLMLCVALLLSVTATGTFAKDIDVAEWNEEVRLSDGSMVTIWRQARAYSSGFPLSHRGRDIDFDLRYEPLGLSWHATLSDTYVRHPISFDIIDGQAFLVLWILDAEGCRGRSLTSYQTQFLRWDRGQWTEVAQSEFPVGRALMNLADDFWGPTAKEDFKGLVRWQSKLLPGAVKAGLPVTVKTYFEQGRFFCKPPPAQLIRGNRP